MVRVVIRLVLVLVLAPRVVAAQALEPIAYTLRFPDPASHLVEVQAHVPVGGRVVELMMPVWSPGYYRVEDYAANVRDLAAATPAGEPLAVEASSPSHWRIDARGASSVRLSYRVFCDQRTVTTNYVDGDYAVLNGAPTFITLAERARRPHDVTMELPAGWGRAMTGLEERAGAVPNAFRAADYETLVDSPILAGKLGVQEFTVGGRPHYVVSAGNVEGWDEAGAVRDLKTFVEESERFWGFLPYDKYLFLVLFRPGGGGLEHKNSNLSTVVARSGADGRWASLGLLAHEYFHLYNAKRLRPVELGPFDFEKAPTTGSLWIAEGVTSYYSGLLLARSGLQTRDGYLAALSSLIGSLQNAPGRLLQSVERSSIEVWTNSNSGVAPSAATVSYYNKGQVMGLLLDARIRRMTGGARSLDDVMRLAYERYAGARGYTADEFRRTAEEVAGGDLSAWFRSTVSSTEELDYTDVLEWFGLRFVPSGGPMQGNWTLQVSPDRTETQRRNLEAWLTGR